MEYIHGITAADLQERGPGSRAPFGTLEQDYFGTPEQDQTFRRQLAAIQVELSLVQFDLIGSLYQDLETQEFYIGPDCQTNQGPWNSAKQYYHDLAIHAYRRAARLAPTDVQDDLSFGLPFVFEKTIGLYTDPSLDRGPFGLANRDFGVNNVLVDENFTILAIIDLDGLMSAPIEVQAQFPGLAGLDLAPPFHQETLPLAIKRAPVVRQNLLKYQEYLQDREDEIGHHVGIGQVILSEASVAFCGLMEYNQLQLHVNQKWMYSLLRLTRNKLLGTEDDE